MRAQLHECSGFLLGSESVEEDRAEQGLVYFHLYHVKLIYVTFADRVNSSNICETSWGIQDTLFSMFLQSRAHHNKARQRQVICRSWNLLMVFKSLLTCLMLILTLSAAGRMTQRNWPWTCFKSRMPRLHGLRQRLRQQARCVAGHDGTVPTFLGAVSWPDNHDCPSNLTHGLSAMLFKATSPYASPCSSLIIAQCRSRMCLVIRSSCTFSSK